MLDMESSEDVFDYIGDMFNVFEWGLMNKGTQRKSHRP